MSQTKSSNLPPGGRGMSATGCRRRSGTDGPAGFAEHPLQAALLGRIEWPGRDQVDLDAFACRLAQAELVYGCDGKPVLGRKRRPELPAVRQAQHVPLPAVNPAQDRQSPAAGTRLTDLGKVAEPVTDQGHGEVVQGGQHHLAGLARCTGPAVGVQDLDDEILRLHVVVLVPGALQGDVAGLLAAVGVGDPGRPRLPSPSRAGSSGSASL